MQAFSHSSPPAGGVPRRGAGRRLAATVAVLACLVWFAAALPRTASVSAAAATPSATPTPNPANSPYLLPWSGGQTASCVQGNNGSFSHHGLEAYAWDFAMPVGSPVLAARGGTVRFVKDDSNVGGPNWKQFASQGNYVVVDHGDGTSALYLHLMLHGAVVKVGDRVRQGQLLAFSGATGFASGPHLHFMVEKTDPDSPYTQSLPARFKDVTNNGGVPIDGTDYTSGNAVSPVAHAPTIINISNPPPSPTGTPGSAVGSGPSTLDVAFLKDVTLADGSTVFAGQTFTKVWLVRNNGTSAWPGGTHLVLTSPSQLQVLSTSSIDTLAPGAAVSINVQLRAPFGAADSGEQDVWRLADANGTTFGDNLWLRVQVAGRLPTLPAAALPPDRQAQYFSQTSHNVSGPFLAFYRSHGGLDMFGYPRTEEIQQDGMTVQWFQRARFELHPELPAGQQVQLTLLGDQLATDQRPFPTTAPFASSAQHEYFPQTKHAVNFGFLQYFHSHGALDNFGYPTSEELRVAGPHGPTTIQWFQRARFEYHPEFAGTPYQVELGLLGDEALTGMGWLPLPPGAGIAPVVSSTPAPSPSVSPTASATPTPTSSTVTASQDTNPSGAGTTTIRAGQTVTVTAAGLRVHADADASAMVTGYLAHGASVRVVAVQGGWLQVADASKTLGWVDAAYVTAV